MSAIAVLRDDWRNERRVYGFAGLLPFLACLAVLSFSDDSRWVGVASDTLRTYAAVIASFLGAVHWGASADADSGPGRARLRWGIMPALLAWTLLALPAAAAFAGFATLFALILVVDRHLLPVLDDSYRQLRLQLSLVVIATLLVAALVTPTGSA